MKALDKISRLDSEHRLEIKTNDGKMSVFLPVKREEDFHENLLKSGGSGTLPSNHPSMMYQIDLLHEISRCRTLREKLETIQKLITYNQWHYRPVEHFNEISKFNLLSESDSFFPMKYYWNDGNKVRDGIVIEWYQKVFEIEDSYRLHLDQIDSFLRMQASVAKHLEREKERNSGVKKERGIELNSIVIEILKDYVLASPDHLKQTRRDKASISFRVAFTRKYNGKKGKLYPDSTKVARAFFKYGIWTEGEVTSLERTFRNLKPDIAQSDLVESIFNSL